ncbi:MAG: hypothetical protein KDE51_17490, partial [Anaerolineales bacterium]|nr:hypothetical protein [Anaerolineales bacterium]
PENDPNSSSQLGANVPKIGQLDNEAGANGRILQSITAAEFGQVTYEGAMESMALNEEEDVKVGDTIDGVKPIIIGPDVIPILQTGKIPLYRHVIGIPPIAGANLGADIWFSAKLTYEGRIVVNPFGKNSAALKVVPSATVGVEAWLKGEIMFGLVDVGAKADADITVDIPFCFINGTKYDGGSLFKYRLYINWWAEAGIWPFRKSITGREKIFDDQKALTQGKCPAPYADAYLAKHIYTYEEDEPPTSAYPAMSTDTLGHTLTVWNSEESNIFSSSYNGIGWTTPLQVTSNNASSSPQVAFMSPNRAVAVWAESSLTPQLAETADLTETLKAQHLMYALWNGTSWSAPQNLTAPTTGDGGVALASCLNLDENCPAGGAVTAVWVHDEVGDPTAQNYHLYYATYQGGSWSTPQLVDPNSRGSETQPTVVYQFGSPVVGWIRDEDQSLSTVEDRYFLLRNLSGPYTYFHTTLPTPIEEPSLAVDIEGNLRLAYTFVTDFEAHWGNQRQIGSAAQDCPDIACEWSFQLYQDDYGRPIHGEAPIMTLASNGVGLVSYRALGFGPDENGEVIALDHDPVGVTVGTGEVAQLKTSFTTEIINPVYLSEDGQVNWQVAAVFDPLLQTTHVAAVQGIVPEIVNPDAAQDIRFADPAAGEGLYFTNQQQFPDFAVTAIEPETLYPDAESLFDVTVTLLNSGVNWSGEEEGIEMALIASWDGPAGVGETAGSTIVSQLLTGQPAEVVVSVTSPPNPDLQHDLYITVNPLLTAAEQNVSNNRMVLTMAGMPTPQNLSGMTKQGSSLVYLTWDAVDDHRVSGYRIYQQIEGEYVPIGNSPTNGFLNFTALFGDTNPYAVTTFTDSGAESPLSEAITVTPQPVGVWIPFIAN